MIPASPSKSTARAGLIPALLGLAAGAVFVVGLVGGAPSIAGLRGELVLFALTLIGVALLPERTLHAALAGLAAVVAFKLLLDPAFPWRHHLLGEAGLLDQLRAARLRTGEWAGLLNLLGLLLGFAVLGEVFQASRVPDVLPRVLPDDWKGPLALLGLVFVLSSFLDNIAAALIGGTVARAVFAGRVHVGYLAAIVAAANAGGAGSVVGDTTTTMMWIDGVRPLDVLHAYVGGGAAILVCGVIGARQQDRLQPIAHDPEPGVRVDGVLVAIVALILAGAIAANVLLSFPALGVWLAILAGAALRPIPWRAAGRGVPAALFLCALVTLASLMPVSELPAASARTAFGLGAVSSVFDNIPLTKLALVQGGHDWGLLAYAVGFGGSITWFGSSAGVALTTVFPEGRSLGRWLRDGWHVALAYVVGFVLMLALLGFRPHAPHR
jgi:hypothetical protein